MGRRGPGSERAPGFAGTVGGEPAWNEMEEGASEQPFPLSLPSSGSGAWVPGARRDFLDRWAREPETTPTPNPPPTEEEKTESNQEVANPEHYIKHPLQNRWALWFFKNDKSKTWQANLRLISKFDTVEDFWALYNHIQLSSNLMPGCDYSLFKDGIEPMWEDEKNKRGGRWLITLNKQQRRSDLDRFWLETLLCLIGESFDDYSDDVCGAVVNVRAKGDKIAIWTTECENRDAVTHIGRVYKERLGLPPKIVIGYQSHADTATKSGSTTKNRFVV
ncbi:eukaryotic translation initiation factor 4E isoform X1 [Sus scrofa]|uniref:Eukaryotic translation initiation factor 4E n=2 Tax=Sus scrofa TaxID=9823 RepID=A0A8D0PVK2_PIG|nr:eukaryotic translation initiation factor 4E isoform X1 [Sus scrofa]